MQRLLLFGALWPALSVLASPPVHVRLRSSWPAPPLLLEILETVSTENETAFFPFLDRLTDPSYLPTPPPTTPEAIYHFALQTAVDLGLVSEPAVREAVELGLALHASTPKIEAFYQYYLDHDLPKLTKECGSWVDWYGTQVCDAETLAHLAGHETIAADAEGNITIPDYTAPTLLTIDHVTPSPLTVLKRPPRTAILYGSPFSPNFRSLHTYLLELSSGPIPRVKYVFRHPPTEARDPAEKTYLSGYGVVLDLKKTDYLVVDDRGNSHAGDTDSSVDAAVEESLIASLLDSYPEPDEFDVTKPIDRAELLDLGAQATELIVNSENPFATLKHLAQDFPKYAVPLARRINASDELNEEIFMNSMKTTPGGNAVWLNGATVLPDDMTPFGLLRVMRKERNLMKSLTSLGLSVGEAIQVVSHPAVTKAQSESDILDGLVNASDRPEGGDLIVYWNNIEKDSRYANWDPSLTGFLRPVYPGQPITVKRNIFNVITALDLSQTSSLYFITGPMQALIKRNYALRFGLVPIIETEAGLRMARLFYYSILKFGRGATMNFLRQIARLDTPPNEITAHVQWDHVEKQWEEFVKSQAEYDENGVQKEVEVPELESILTIKNQVISKKLGKAQAWTERMQATLKESLSGHIFVNGRHYDLDDDFLRSLNIEINGQTAYLQSMIYTGQLADEEGVAKDMSTYFYDLPDTLQRRSRYTTPNAKNGGLQLFNIPDLFAKSGYEVSEDSFLARSALEHIPITAYIIGDLSSDEGVELVKEGLLSFSRSPLARFSFIHNPKDEEAWQNPPIVITAMVKGLFSQLTPEDLIGFLDRQKEAKPVIEEHLLEKYNNIRKSSRLLLRELGIPPGESWILMNGRLVGPIEGGTFKQGDWISLESYELRKRVEPTIDALRDVLGYETLQRRSYFADIVPMVSSVASAIQVPDPAEAGLNQNAPLRPRTLVYQILESNHTLFTHGDNNTALYHFAILVDPLSDSAQKWSSLIEWLISVPSVYMEVHLNPAPYTEVPLKRFYRSTITPRLQFDEEFGSEVLAQTLFHSLPPEPIYTLGMEVPHSWLVRPRESLVDLDNIQLNALSPAERTSGVEAIFELDFLVIEGHARETLTSQPPRGLQLQLTTSQSKVVDDTQVVATLGYFQFKTKPGVFQLEIREGRGRDIYSIESAGNEGWSSPTVEQAGGTIMVASFDGVTIFPRVLRRPGMERADVLGDLSLPKSVTPDSGISLVMNEMKSKFNSAFGSFFSSPTTEGVTTGTTDVVNAQADINIFTVASGLLYERFVGIMILSVLRNTNSTVKFWFIENFLSPSFLEFIPHFAKAYNFQYELVTYKWPSWLRAQKEKQRIIWAYKILFLDVLFPMDLKKVIFVDADQIVRSDLQELVDLDLHGAPYGYTPMGDDNEDMEGFRFWKTGYWKEYLQGRSYHISALYVIDLVRFRKMAAGDILRREYQGLSADPNSLANLDQDLPNNLQQLVPIFSLPEDWLWCETWCSKDRLHRAKTIDLCQNPLTKEPKLARARAIPEWDEYDAEIARFARKLADEGVLHSSLATAGVDALANANVNAASTPAPAEEPEVVEAEEVVKAGDSQSGGSETTHTEEYHHDEL